MKGLKIFLTSILMNIISGKQWLRVLLWFQESKEKHPTKSSPSFFRMFRCFFLHDLMAKFKLQVEQFNTGRTLNGIFILTLAYYGFLTYRISDLKFRVVLFSALIVSLVIYFKNSYVEPSAEQLLKIESTSARLESIDAKQKLVNCDSCHAPKMLRVAHCDLCSRCVFTPISHSLALNSCITSSNNLWYIVYLSLNIYLIYLFLKLGPVFVILKFFNYFLLLNMSLELVEHIACIANNLTGPELMDPAQFLYLRTGRQKDLGFYNPFDKGFVNNFVETFKRNMRFRTMATKVEEELSEIVITGDSLDFESIGSIRLNVGTISIDSDEEKPQFKSGNPESSNTYSVNNQLKEEMILFLRGLARDYTKEYFDPTTAKLVSVLQISCPMQRSMLEKMERIVLHSPEEF